MFHVLAVSAAALLDGKRYTLTAGTHYFLDAVAHAKAVPEVAKAWTSAGYGATLA